MARKYNINKRVRNGQRAILGNPNFVAAARAEAVPPPPPAIVKDRPQIIFPQDRTLYLTFYRNEQELRGRITKETIREYITSSYGENIVENIIISQRPDGYPRHGYLIVSHPRFIAVLLGHKPPPRKVRLYNQGYASMWIKYFLPPHLRPRW